MCMIGILYFRRDPGITTFTQSLERKGIPYQLIDMEGLHSPDSAYGIDDNLLRERMGSHEFTGFFNRAIPSIDSNSLAPTTLGVVKYLEENRFPVLNPYDASAVDYSKQKGCEDMTKAGIATPDTKLLVSRGTLEDFVRDHGLPVVIKGDMSGCSRFIRRVVDEDQLERELQLLDSGNSKKPYVVQEFCTPSRDYDVRISVMDGEVFQHFGRKLTNGEGYGAWKGTSAGGKNLVKYDPSEDVRELAIRATESIGAVLNALDIYFTESGLVVIENNPTPGFKSTAPPPEVMDWIIDRSMSWFDKRRDELS